MDYSRLCPKCSGRLTSVGDRTGGFSGKKAVLGSVIAGPVGVVAGLLGKKLVTMQCVKCGYTTEMNEKAAKKAAAYGDVYGGLAEIERDLVKRSIGGQKTALSQSIRSDEIKEQLDEAKARAREKIDRRKRLLEEFRETNDPENKFLIDEGELLLAKVKNDIYI